MPHCLKVIPRTLALVWPEERRQGNGGISSKRWACRRRWYGCNRFRLLANWTVSFNVPHWTWSMTRLNYEWISVQDSRGLYSLRIGMQRSLSTIIIERKSLWKEPIVRDRGTMGPSFLPRCPPPLSSATRSPLAIGRRGRLRLHSEKQERSGLFAMQGGAGASALEL
jgi:hypothetical protein